MWSLLLFPLLDTGSAVAFGIGLTGTLALYGLSYGPVGAFLPELFATRYRYTGAGTGYNLGESLAVPFRPSSRRSSPRPSAASQSAA